MNSKTEQLVTLFNRVSKHSNYQILPECLKPYLNQQDISVKSRYEKERLQYILSKIYPSGKHILDIGGNSGYFSFEFLDHGAAKVDYYEGNSSHAEFVKVSAELLNFQDQISVSNKYYNFREPSGFHHDIVLLLNVLHHVGDDYGAKDLSIENAKAQIIESINHFSGKTDYMVFQLGFCWKGDRNMLLFEHGTKEEMINFLTGGIRQHWNVEEIAVAERVNDEIVYRPLNDNNIKRSDAMGEFLNRPIFILRSKH